MHIKKSQKIKKKSKILKHVLVTLPLFSSSKPTEQLLWCRQQSLDTNNIGEKKA